jgi:hypothetical protein
MLVLPPSLQLLVLFVANVLLAIFSETIEGRQGHLISLVLILLIGFGNCAVQFSN